MKLLRLGTIGALAGIMLAGCSPLWQGAIQGVAGSVKSPAAMLMSAAPAEVGNLLYVEVGDRAAVHVGIVSPTNSALTWWAAPDGVTLSVLAGQLVATEGMPGDLRGMRWIEAPSAFAPDELPKQTLIKSYDALDGAVADTRYTYRFELTTEAIKVWGGERKRLLRVSEVQTARPALGSNWPGNRYWLDPETRQVWRAEVYYRPDQKMILLPKTPWHWAADGWQTLLKPLPVLSEADPLTRRYRLDGSLRLNKALVNLVLPDPLGLSLLQRSAVPEQKFQRQSVMASLKFVQSQGDIWPGLPAWQKVLLSSPANGRVPLPAQSPVRLELLATVNPLLQSGDILVTGHRVNTVTVWDIRLAQPCVQPHVAWQRLSDYLDTCLGKLPRPDQVWLAHADASVAAQPVAMWNRTPAPWPEPGLQIVTDLPVLAHVAADPELAKGFAHVLATRIEGGNAP